MVLGRNHLLPLIAPFLSNPIVDWIDDKFTALCVNTLKSGPIPQHVAFIMDGNRRYAKNKGLEIFKGHEAGSASLVTIIDSCFKLNISNVTIYAFSIENFNRSKEEVDKLFEILVDKLNLFLDNEKEYNKIVQIKIIGNKDLIPLETLVKLEEIEKLTSVNTDLILNVCFAYTSRDEITHSMEKTIDQTLNNELVINQINSDILNQNFYFDRNTPKVDILIRTSGHTRLSDFLIWQINDFGMIEFLNVYWPEFTSLQYYFILLKWSYNKSIQEKLTQWESFKSTNNEIKKIDLKSLTTPPPFVSILGD